MFKCENCRKVFEEPDCIYVFELRIEDSLSSIWVKVYGHIAEFLFKRTAKEMDNLWKYSKKDGQLKLVNDIRFQVIYKF